MRFGYPAFFAGAGEVVWHCGVLLLRGLFGWLAVEALVGCERMLLFCLDVGGTAGRGGDIPGKTSVCLSGLRSPFVRRLGGAECSER